MSGRERELLTWLPVLFRTKLCHTTVIIAPEKLINKTSNWSEYCYFVHDYILLKWKVKLPTDLMIQYIYRTYSLSTFPAKLACKLTHPSYCKGILAQTEPKQQICRGHGMHELQKNQTWLWHIKNPTRPPIRNCHLSKHQISFTRHESSSFGFNFYCTSLKHNRLIKWTTQLRFSYIHR